jgi:hypothetical protein
VDRQGVPWLQFGDERVYCAEERRWAGLTQAAAGAGLRLREHAGSIDRQRLHVVVQKGRLFQKEHPDIPVLLDKGRFLLVDIDPAAARLAAKEEPCYALRALGDLATDGPGDSRSVFAVRSREADGTASAPANPAVQAVVDRISRRTFEADLVQLAALPTRLSTSASYKTACDLVDRQLASLGYATARQPISVGGKPSQNVVATRRGSGGAGRGMVLVTAHLDSVNQEDGPGARAPGADDDASGSAGAIEIARALQAHSGLNDLQIVLFGGEEQGLLGSKHYVASLSAEQRAAVRAVIHMDMIGRLNTSQPAVLLEGAAVSRQVIDGLAGAAARYTSLTVETSLNSANSDHVSFINKGIPGVLTIEGADSTNHEIHSARDTLELINFDLAVEILRMNAAFAAEALGRA